MALSPGGSVVVGALAVGALLLVAPLLFERVRRTLQVVGVLHARRARRARDTDITRVAAYHRALPEARRSEALDERTWADLDMDEVLRALDRTESEPGRQYLYHLLRTPHATA